MPQTIVYSPPATVLTGPGRSTRVQSNGDVHVIPPPPTQIVGLLVNVVTIASSYTVGADDLVILANASGGALTITLPPSSGNAGREIRIKKIDSSANAVTIAAQGTSRIDGAATTSLSAQYARATLVCDGANWFLF